MSSTLLSVFSSLLCTRAPQASSWEPRLKTPSSSFKSWSSLADTVTSPASVDRVGPNSDTLLLSGHSKSKGDSITEDSDPCMCC
ncbi:hypothetical protein K438DRAFT_1829194, partial [Mycena galopus ATCC 62051]